MKKAIFIFLGIILLSGFALPKKKILIIGDSTSKGYTPFVREMLSDVATLAHNENPDNSRNTAFGLRHIHQWLGDTKWDLILFNWGDWDFAYRGGKYNLDSHVTGSLFQYETNLDSLVTILEGTGAKLAFITTSYIPEGENERRVEDAIRYNNVAKKIMKRHKVLVCDIYPYSKKVHKDHARGKGNVHFTPEGYELLGKEVAKFIRKKML